MIVKRPIKISTEDNNKIPFGIFLRVVIEKQFCVLLRRATSDFAKKFSLLASSDFLKTYEVERESNSTK